MADLTATQIADLRFDMGDMEIVFDDTQLNRLWARTASLTDDTKRIEAVKGLMIRRLLTNAAEFNNHTVGQTREERAAVFDHYAKLYTSLYAPLVDALVGTKHQLAIAAVRSYPQQSRTQPSEAEPYDFSGDDD